MPYPSLDPASHSLQTHAGHLCGACHKTPPYFDRAVSAGPYEGTLAEAIKLFKYKKKVHIGRALANQMIIAPYMMCYSDLVSESQGHDSCIIPVPLHPKRLREREFNQSAIIASELGKQLEIPVLLDVLIRSRHTRPQVELDMKERMENVVGSFTIRKEEEIAEKDIILVDDVYTTGSTVKECAKVLKKNGAGRVYVITIARMVG
jgi:ComF family protein